MRPNFHDFNRKVEKTLYNCIIKNIFLKKSLYTTTSQRNFYKQKSVETWKTNKLSYTSGDELKTSLGHLFSLFYDVTIKEKNFALSE